MPLLFYAELYLALAVPCHALRGKAVAVSQLIRLAICSQVKLRMLP